MQAEKVQSYMENKLKNRDGMIEKLRLKNVTIKAGIQKIEGQLKQKEEMGDVLHYIDFHQLQIENKQYNKRIDERNDELLKLKMNTGVRSLDLPPPFSLRPSLPLALPARPLAPQAPTPSLTHHRRPTSHVSPPCSGHSTNPQ